MDTIARKQIFLDEFVGFPLRYGWWAISEDSLFDIVQFSLHREPQVILDIGTGTTTVVLAKYAQKMSAKNIDIKIVSVDADQKWLEDTRLFLQKNNLEKFVTLVHAPIVKTKYGQYYDIDQISTNLDTLSVDLMIVDGPPWNTEELARFPAMPAFKKYFSDDVVVFLDDGIREFEKEIADRWKKDHPEFTCEYREYQKGGFVFYKKGGKSEKALIQNHRGATFEGTLFKEIGIVNKKLDVFADISAKLSKSDVMRKKFRAIAESKNREVAELRYQNGLEKKAASTLAKKVADLESHAILNQNQLKEVLDSKSYGVGSLFFRSVKKPVKLITFPLNLTRILLKEKMPIRVEGGGDQSTDVEAMQNLPQKIREKNTQNASQEFLIAGDAARIHDGKMRIAGIMDEFTHTSFKYECEITQLTPENWLEEITACNPDMLFIESAWRGKDDLWRSRVHEPHPDLRDIIDYCNRNNIPTIFWNKEDPVHFDHFLLLAGQCDHVFTTDLNCVDRYKEVIGHSNVHLLPFACQPQTTNPLEKYVRQNAVAFAGSYVPRYKERTKDLATVIGALRPHTNIDIYDRNYGKDIAGYKFPPDLNELVVGSLAFTHIDKAYRGYRYAINMTSVKDSPTMFARRVFELLASNTLVISNYSPAISDFFGDLVICSDDADEIAKQFQELKGDERRRDEIKTAGLRKVLSRHTYKDRLLYICSEVFGDFAMCPKEKKICVVASVQSKDELQRVVGAMQIQEYSNADLVIFADEWCKSDDKGVNIIHPSKREAFYKNQLKEYDGCSFFSAQDYYGQFFLRDLYNATQFSGNRIISKSAFYKYDDGLTIVNRESQYISVNRMQLRSGYIPKDFITLAMVKDFIASPEESYVEDENILTIDYFNYCQGNIMELTEAQKKMINGESCDIEKGISLAEIIKDNEVKK